MKKLLKSNKKTLSNFTEKQINSVAKIKGGKWDMPVEDVFTNITDPNDSTDTSYWLAFEDVFS